MIDPHKPKRLLTGRLFLVVRSPAIRANVPCEVANFFIPTFRKYTIVLLASSSNIVPQPYLEWRTYCPIFSFIASPRSSSRVCGRSHHLGRRRHAAPSTRCAEGEPR